MKCYCEIGERTKWRNRQYRCVEFKDHENGDNCEGCGLIGDTLACGFIACMKNERTDKKDVFFRLEPRFRKEKNNE